MNNAIPHSRLSLIPQRRLRGLGLITGKTHSGKCNASQKQETKVRENSHIASMRNK